MPAPRVLILGGTREARDLAAALQECGIAVVSSLAGRVRNPKLPVGEVRIGGFGGVEGLARYINDGGITHVVDATHPFAAVISGNATAAASIVGVPRVQLRRPGYEPVDGDQWHLVDSLEQAREAIPQYGRRPFITTGRGGLAAFTTLECDYCLVRCVDPPDVPLPPAAHVLLARGPFDAVAEAALMRDHQIDVLVTKDSGGSLTAGKLVAARTLGISVIMVRRPAQQLGDVVADVAGALEWLRTC